MRGIALALVCVACSSGIYGDDRVYVQAQKAALSVSIPAAEGVVLATLTFTNGSLAQTVEPKIGIMWRPNVVDEVQLVGIDGTSSFELAEHEERTVTLVGAFSSAVFDPTLCDHTVLVANLRTTVDCRK